MQKFYPFKTKQAATILSLQDFSQLSTRSLCSLKNKLVALLLLIFFFARTYSQTIVDGSFEHCNTSSLAAAAANTVQTTILTPCGSPATLSGTGFAFFTNGTIGSANNGCAYLSPPPSDGLRDIGFGHNVLLTVPLTSNLVTGNCYTITLDGINAGGSSGGGKLCSPAHDAAFEIGASNSSTTFGTSVGTTSLMSPVISPDKNSYATLTVTFVAPAGTNNFLTFRLADQSNDKSILFIDNVVLTGTCMFPVTLLSFSGRRTNGNDQLTWVTASEQNTSEFDVEYGTDGIHFSLIGTMAAAGNSSVEKEYRFTNSNVNGDALYRLKTVDIDGKFTYSRVIRLAQTTTCNQDGFEITNMSPSPFSDQFIVEYCTGSTTKINAKLFDVAGRLMAKRDITIPQGQGNFTINDLSKLVAGIYILQLQDEQGNTVTKKLIKQ
jgi:hypothetical protein